VTVSADYRRREAADSRRTAPGPSEILADASRAGGGGTDPRRDDPLVRAYMLAISRHGGCLRRGFGLGLRTALDRATPMPGRARSSDLRPQRLSRRHRAIPRRDGRRGRDGARTRTELNRRLLTCGRGRPASLGAPPALLSRGREESRPDGEGNPPWVKSQSSLRSLSPRTSTSCSCSTRRAGGWSMLKTDVTRRWQIGKASRTKTIACAMTSFVCVMIATGSARRSSADALTASCHDRRWVGQRKLPERGRHPP
jgi:hypothetical protein